MKQKKTKQNTTHQHSTQNQLLCIFQVNTADNRKYQNQPTFLYLFMLEAKAQYLNKKSGIKVV